MDFSSTIYNQLSNEQGIGVENLFTHGLVYKDYIYPSLYIFRWLRSPSHNHVAIGGKMSLYLTY
jgi:hypothetical protein